MRAVYTVHGNELARVEIPDTPGAEPVWTGSAAIREAAMDARTRAPEDSPSPGPIAALLQLAYEANGCSMRGPYRTLVYGAKPRSERRDDEDRDGDPSPAIF